MLKRFAFAFLIILLVGGVESCSETIIDPLQSISNTLTISHELPPGPASFTDSLPLPDFSARQASLADVTQAKITSIYFTGFDTSMVLSASAALNGVMLSTGFRQSTDTLFFELGDSNLAQIFKTAAPILMIELSTTTQTPLPILGHVSTLFIAPYRF